MDKLLIVDGSNLLFQMFFGMPARIVNGEGKAIQGTLGFVGALLKIIRKVAPTHILAVFDGEHENSRCEIDADYKANRLDYSMVNETENPFSQLPDVYKALDFMGIKYIETTNCEADDMMASYALSFCDSADIVICSFDSDFFQLISERISVLRYRGEKTMIPSVDKGIHAPSTVFWRLAALTSIGVRPVRLIPLPCQPPKDGTWGPEEFCTTDL